MERSLADQRQQIRRWSVIVGILMTMLLCVYTYGRTHRVPRVLGADGHHHASGSAIALGWLVLLGFGFATAAAVIRRRNLIQRYNAQILAEDPMLRGDRVPIID